MAATNVFVAQDVPLQLGEENWECWCSSIELTPDQTMTDVTPLCSADVRQLPGPITWTLDLTYYQDWTSGGGTTGPVNGGGGGGGGGDGGDGDGDIETTAATRAASQDGISEWLFDHWGEEMPFAIGPAQEGGAVLTGICKIVAGAFGATSGDVAEGSVSLPAWNIQKIPGPKWRRQGCPRAPAGPSGRLPTPGGP